MKETKTRKRRGFLLVAIPVLLVSNGLLLINYFGKNYASEALNRLINREIPDNYRVAYDKVSLDIWNRSLEINELRFFADTLTGQNNNRIYEIVVPAFRIKLHSISSIFLKKELIIEGLSIFDPEISIRDFTSGTRSTVTTESAGLFTIVSRYLNLFEIAYLNIEEANFSYRKNWEFALEDFNFRVKQFAIDSTLQRKNFFNAESVELIITEESFYLSDSTHLLSFDQLRLSTTDSSLSFHNIHLQPTGKVLALHEKGHPHPTAYNIHVPEFSLTGIDYFSTYLDRALKIQQVKLLKPDISIDSEHSPGKKPTNSTDAVVEAVSRFAPAVEIQHILVEGGSIETNRQTLKVDTIDFYDLKIDPENLFFTVENPPFRHFRVMAGQFRHQSRKGGQQLQIGSLYLDSQDERLDLQDVTVSLGTQPEKNNRRSTLVIPGLQVSGIDYPQAMMNSRLQMNDLVILDPQVQVPLPGRDTSKKEPSSNVLSFQKVFAGLPLKSIRANALQVLNGSLTAGSYLTIGNYSLSLRSVFIHSRLQSLSEGFRALQWESDNVRLSLPGLQLGVAHLATDGSNYLLKNLQANYRDQESLVVHRSEAWEILNTDLDSLISGKYQIDSVFIRKGRTELQLSGSGKTDSTAHRTTATPSLPIVNYLGIADQKVSAKLPAGRSVNIDRMGAALSWDGRLNLLELQLDSIDFLQPGNLQAVFVDQLHKTPPNESFELTDINLQFDSSGSPLENLHFPQLQVVDWDRERSLSEGRFICRHLNIEGPEIHIDARNAPLSPDSSTSPSALPVHIGTINVDEAALYYIGGSAKDSIRLDLPLFDLEIDSIDGWSYDDIQLNAHRPVYFSTKFLEVNAQSLNVDTKSGHLLTDELSLHHQKGRQKLDLSTKLLLLEGFTPEALVDSRQLAADEIFLNGLDIRFQADTSQRQKPANLSDTLTIGLQLAIRDFRLQDADCLLLGRDSVQLSGINIFAKGIDADSLIPLRGLDGTFEDLSLGINDISLTIGQKKEYRLNQSLRYDANEKKLTLSNVRLDPLYSREAYSFILDQQADHFDAEVGKIVLSPLKLGSLFERPLHLQKLDLSRVRLDVYRDKNVPRVNTQTPLIQEQLKAIAFPFVVDSVKMRGDISVSELASNETEPSLITFNRVNALLAHVTNDSAHLEQPMILKATGTLYGQGNFDAKVIFDLKDSLQTFHMDTRLSRMEMQSLNQLLTPMAKIHLQSGKNKALVLQLTGNHHQAIGEMYFRYNKLKFQIVSKDDLERVSFGNSILSFFANRLVKSNNPSFLRKREGIIYFERDKEKAIFNFWAKSILSGVISSIGVRNNRKHLKHMSIEELEKLSYRELFGERLKMSRANRKERKTK